MSAKTGPKPKLTAAERVQVHNLAAQGYSDSQIAARYGVSRTTILRLRNSPGPAGDPAHADSGDALAEYKALADDAFVRAIRGEDVAQDVTYLRQAEDALAANGIVASDGRPWKFSVLVGIAQR